MAVKQKELPEDVKRSKIKDVLGKVKPIPQEKVESENIAQEAIQDKSKESGSRLDNPAIASALLTALPTVIGGALQGAEGASIGANVGSGAAQKFVDKQEAEKAQTAKLQREDTIFERQQNEKKRQEQARREELKAEQEFSAGEAEKQRAFQAEQAGIQRGHQKGLAEAANAAKMAEQAIKAKEGSAKIEEGLRKEYTGNAVTKDTAKVVSAFAKVQKASENPSAAGDLSLIFNYMKMLDPGSVVREGEFATAQNAAGVPDRIRNMYNNLKSGQRLNATQRADFAAQAQNVYQAQSAVQSQIDQQFQQLAERSGANPQNILITSTAPESKGIQEIQKSAQGEEENAIDAANSPEEIQKIVEQARSKYGGQ